MLRRLLVLVVVALTTVIVSDASAHAACRCKDLSLPQQVNNAGAVFSGTLTMASGPTTSGDRQTMSYDVKVDRVYKGDITSPRVTVKSDASEAACGLTGMTADTRYLFFVRVSDADLFANSCGGTGPAKSARTQKIVALLGPGSTPNPPTPTARWSGRSAWTPRSTVPTSTRPPWRAAQGDLSSYTNQRLEPPDHALGRSRGSKT